MQQIHTQFLRRRRRKRAAMRMCALARVNFAVRLTRTPVHRQARKPKLFHMHGIKHVRQPLALRRDLTRHQGQTHTQQDQCHHHQKIFYFHHAPGKNTGLLKTRNRLVPFNRNAEIRNGRADAKHCNAGFPASEFGRLSSRPFPEAPGTGKSREPAGWKACVTSPVISQLQSSSSTQTQALHAIVPASRAMHDFPAFTCGKNGVVISS